VAGWGAAIFALEAVASPLSERISAWWTSRSITGDGGDLVAEDLAPGAEWLVARDDQGGALVAGGDEREHARTTPEDVAIDLERRQAGLGAGAGSCTRDRVGWYAFEAFAEAGRSLYVLVVVGRRAPARERAELKRLLASLHFSPRGAAAPLPQSPVGQRANPAATGVAADS
jgi:hypothetical protein